MTSTSTTVFERHDSAQARREEILSELRGLIEGLEAVERRMSALAEECFDEPTQPNLALTEALAEGM